MKALNTARLNHIVDIIKPYRASNPPRYPISKRTHNTKVFTIDELDGEKIYRIFYGFEYDTESVSKEEYLANFKTNSHYREHTWVDDNSPDRYSKYSTAPKELGIVRQDNTFEFTAKKGYGQGENMIMTSWSVGSLSTNSRQGGMIFREYYSYDQGGIMHPIFRGLRVDCDTWEVHESSQYKLFGYRVDRKKGNEFLSGYADFYKVCGVMMQAMDTKSLLETGVEVALENGADLKSYFLPTELQTKFLAIANREKNNTPLDCGLLFAMAHNVSEFYRRVRMYHEAGIKHYNDQLDKLFVNLIRKLNKELYRENKSVMKEIEYTAGRYYPPSEWGIKLVDLQGNELQQY